VADEDVSLLEQERNIKVRQIERRKNSLDKSLNKLEKRLQEVAEESKYFLKALDTLQKIEPLKPYDDPQCQREYWNQKLAEELNLRMALKQPIDIELAKAIIAIHDEAPIKQQLLNIIDQLQRIEMEEKKQLLEGKKDDEDNDDQTEE
jgi:phenylalanyl-tRNA synthetase alpha subunit